MSAPQVELLLDVPLRVVAELGGCTLAVAQILALGNGSVVELDRGIDEPVDLRVGDKVVARGELVAVGERYGVRITTLADR